MQMVSKYFYGILLGAAGLAMLSPGTANAQAGAQRNTALIEARQRVSDAQAALNEIKAEQKRVKDKLMASFESKEEWKTTVENHKKTKAAYEQAKKQALVAAQAKPEYKKLAKDRAALQTKFEEISDKRDPDTDAITRTGTALTEKSFELKKLEDQAVEQDEKVLDAREAFEAADKEMQALDEEVEGALLNDPDNEQILTQLDQAETQLTTAREAYTQMRKSEQEARSAASRAAAESRKASRPAKSSSKRSGGTGAGY